MLNSFESLKKKGVERSGKQSRLGKSIQRSSKNLSMYRAAPNIQAGHATKPEFTEYYDKHTRAAWEEKPLRKGCRKEGKCGIISFIKSKDFLIILVVRTIPVSPDSDEENILVENSAYVCVF